MYVIHVISSIVEIKYQTANPELHPQCANQLQSEGVQCNQSVRPYLCFPLCLSIRELASDQTLGGVDGVGGVSHRLSLGWQAHQALTLLREGNN